ncbi:ABC transporter permease subunit [Pseudonocardia sp. RS010]|uniref:branched-chain amino acid ABC transporter ATP-binding protein/permease n=1 Tax=Pseudonocardia sp. RS010 TaxID=3385979 RepID=UPI0039A09692
MNTVAKRRSPGPADLAVHIGVPVALALVVLAVSGDSYLTFLATAGAVSYVLTAGFNLVFGYAGIFSLASIALYGIGAYASVYAENTWGLPFWISFPLGAVVAALFAAVLILPTSRIKDIFIAIVTLGFAVAMIEVFAQWDDVTGGAGGLYDIQPPEVAGAPLVGGKVPYLVLSVVIVWLVAELTWRISRSGYGRKLAALREAPRSLSASGLDAGRLRFSVFVLSGGLAGLAGAMYAHFQLTISPESFSILRLIELLLAVVIGGAGTWAGPIVGVVVLLLIDEMGAQLGSLEPVVYGVAVVVLMTLGRHGLVTLAFDLWRRRRRAPLLSVIDSSDAAVAGVAAATARVADAEAHGPAEPILVVDGVSVRFGGVKAVSEVSLSVAPGEVIGLVGPNGAGKTTLFNAITGEVAPAEGAVLLHGRELVGAAPHEVRRRGIGRTFQLPSLVPDLSLLENVMLGGEIRSAAGLVRQSLYTPAARADDRRRRDEALALLTDLGLRDRALGRASDQPYGVQRLAEIARTLMLGPQLLMLDEPGAGLTDEERDQLASVIRRLRERHLTVVLIDHNVSFVAGISDRMVVLDGGRVIAEGDPAEVLRAERVIGAYLGSEATRA